MHRRTILYSAAAIAIVSIAVQAARLGSLTRDSDVTVPSDVASAVASALAEAEHDLYPVFIIQVPSPYVEVQIRASCSNFYPGFLTYQDGHPVANWQRMGTSLFFHALGTPDASPVPLFAVEPMGHAQGAVYRRNFFVYETCTTGKDANAQWGLGPSDPDPWVYFSTQSASYYVPKESDPDYWMSPNFGTEFKRVKWDYDHSIANQLHVTTIGITHHIWSPGRTFLFQPSRSNMGASQWMQKNNDNLIWIYQLADPSGVEKQPNGTPVWHSMHPVEWRKNRILLNNTP